ncbi:MAG: 4-hydroxy-tetrahydrodipicolinate reductase [Bosea sp. (in: a-proteobacteria)]
MSELSPIRLAVLGAGGRMGRMLINTIAESDAAVIAGAVERPGSNILGADVGSLAGFGVFGIKVSDDLAKLAGEIDGVVDFTSPDATIEAAKIAADLGLIHIIGTTGLGEHHLAAIAEAAKRAVIVRSGNMSLGVNLLATLVKQVAGALGQDWDIEITEMHHRHKVDAPSGTAVLLGEAAADGRHVSLQEKRIAGRDGITGPRKAGDIGFAALRGGSVIGDHSVIFAGNGERIELRHIAEDRSLFASGALKAALWARGRKPGLYSMLDVLGLNPKN